MHALLMLSLAAAVVPATSTDDQDDARRVSFVTRGYGGPWFRLTRQEDQVAMLAGGPLVFRIDDRFGAGAFLTTTEASSGASLLATGLLGEYVIAPARRVHGLLNVGFGVTEVITDDLTFELREREARSLLLAQAQLGVRVLDHWRIALGAGWRVIPGRGDLGGPEAILALHYGSFGFESRSRPARVGVSGFYGVKWTSLDGQLAWLDGGGTRVVVGRRWAIGASGYVRRDWFDGGPGLIGAGYGGVLVQYTVADHRRVHLVVGGLVGPGGSSRRTAGTDTYESVSFLVVEPQAGAEWSLFPWARVGLVASYRAALRLGGAPASWSDRSAPALGVDFRFGGFGGER